MCCRFRAGEWRPSQALSSEGDRTPRSNGKKRPSILSSADVRLAAELSGRHRHCPAVARRNALRFGRTFDDEMRILILHGMLHLMGYDHETDTGQMDRREQRLRRALGLD